MKIYLDIDGVLVDYNCNPMPYLREFVDFVFEISNGDVYWLTTHSHDGSTDRPLNYLSQVVEQDILGKLKTVKPTKWDTLKTEGIDLSSDFLWFDDTIFNAEYERLEEVGKEHCLIKVENNLEELVTLLKEDLHQGD
ncbi:MAG TPA: hypothetical protein PLD77_01310 [Candidatus Dojkabacteria bacterium]|mgnify:CR=1 FL=1|nr:hypothetical protein [Candidatus Dojkabacteria bacterium]